MGAPAAVLTPSKADFGSTTLPGATLPALPIESELTFLVSPEIAARLRTRRPIQELRVSQAYYAERDIPWIRDEIESRVGQAIPREVRLSQARVRKVIGSDGDISFELTVKGRDISRKKWERIEVTAALTEEEYLSFRSHARRGEVTKERSRIIAELPFGSDSISALIEIDVVVAAGRPLQALRPSERPIYVDVELLGHPRDLALRDEAEAVRIVREALPELARARYVGELDKKERRHAKMKELAKSGATGVLMAAIAAA